MQKLSKTTQKQSSLRIEFAPHAFDKRFPVICDPNRQKEHGRITFLHYHNALEIGYCHKGEGVIFCNNSIFPYQAGCVTMFLPEQVHFSQSRKGVVSTWTWTYFLQEELLSPFHDDIPALFSNTFQGKSHSPVIAQNAGSEFSKLVIDIIKELHDKRPFYHSMVRCLFFELICGLRRLYGISMVIQNWGKATGLFSMRC